MSTHSKNEQARIIGQIQGCYNNVSTLIRPAINQVEFEKAIQEDKIAFFLSMITLGPVAQPTRTPVAANDFEIPSINIV